MTIIKYFISFKDCTPYLEKYYLTFNEEDLNTDFYRDLNNECAYRKGKADLVSYYKEHSTAFKATLDKIKEPIDLKESAEFIKEDLANLCKTPRTESNQQSFVKSVEPLYPAKVEGYTEYTSVLDHFKHNLKSMNDLTEYVLNDANHHIIGPQFNAALRKSHITTHPKFEELTTLFSAHLQNMNSYELDVLDFIATKYEKLALVTLEPYMIFIFGHVVFLEIFANLHTIGNTTAFVVTATEKHRNIYPYKLFLKDTTFIANKVSSRMYSIAREYKYSCAGSCFILSAVVKMCISGSMPISAGESTTFVNLANTWISSDIDGLNSVYANYIKELAKRIAWEIGDGFGGVWKAAIAGVVHHHEAAIRVIAEAGDAALTKTQNKK